jgi:Lon protease-like protein
VATEVEIQMPEDLPAMTLPNVAFFPQALLPLHIFEPRYRQMLTRVLATNRLMAIAGLNRQRPSGADFEPPYRVAGVGIVRACQGNPDGTSNLLVQGICRAEILEIVAEEPYRRIRIRPLSSEAGASSEENGRLRDRLARLLKLKLKLAAASGNDMTSFLRTIDDPETFIDIAAFSLCESPALKQKLLETLDVHRRLELFAANLRKDIAALRLRHKLQGGTPDDRIEHN